MSDRNCKMTRSDRNRKMTRSIRLKKYEKVYQEYMRDKIKPIKENHRHHHTEKKREEKIKPKLPKKKKPISLNPWQIFFQEESKKDKYRNMRGSERMSVIANVWDKKKRGKRCKKPT